MSYVDEVMADAPSMYWRLNDTGSTFADHSGNDLHGTLFNAPTLRQPSPVAGGHSILFDGISQYGEVPHNPLLDLTTNAGGSIESWVKLVGDPVNLNTVWARPVSGSPTNVPYRLVFEGNTANALKFSVFTNTGRTVDAYNAFDKDWRHVCLTIGPNGVGGTLMRGYVDGVLVGSESFGEEVPVRESGFYIGGENDRRFHNVYLAEVAIYPTTLSTARILQHYESAAVAPGGGRAVVAASLHHARRRSLARL